MVPYHRPIYVICDTYVIQPKKWPGRPRNAENGNIMAILKPLEDGLWPKKPKCEYLSAPMIWAAWEHFWMICSLVLLAASEAPF